MPTTIRPHRTGPTTTDRRGSPRQPIDLGCKVFHHASLRFQAGRSVDISSTGALVEIALGRTLAVGDRVDVAIDWTRCGLLASESLVRGRVVRAQRRPGGFQRLAVAFDSTIEIKAAA